VASWRAFSSRRMAAGCVTVGPMPVYSLSHATAGKELMPPLVGQTPFGAFHLDPATARP
jgi:hypothetical protein